MSVSRVEIVAAVACNGVIGLDGSVPWDLPADLERFRALTLDHSIIMGRKTWNSIGRPLSRRENIILSRQTNFAPRGAKVASSLDEAIAAASMSGPIFVIGGTSPYREAMDIAVAMHITEIHRRFDGDVFFPNIDSRCWREVSRVRNSAGAGLDAFVFDFVTYLRDGHIAAC